MGQGDSTSMTERIVWTLAVATAGAVATAATTKGLGMLWRHLRGTDPPPGVSGVAAVGAGLGRKMAHRFRL